MLLFKFCPRSRSDITGNILLVKNMVNSFIVSKILLLRLCLRVFISLGLHQRFLGRNFILSSLAHQSFWSWQVNISALWLDWLPLASFWMLETNVISYLALLWMFDYFTQHTLPCAVAADFPPLQKLLDKDKSQVKFASRLQGPVSQALFQSKMDLIDTRLLILPQGHLGLITLFLCSGPHIMFYVVTAAEAQFETSFRCWIWKRFSSSGSWV